MRIFRFSVSVKSNLCALACASAALTFACAPEDAGQETADSAAEAGTGGASAGSGHASTAGHANDASRGGSDSSGASDGDHAGDSGDTATRPDQHANGGGPNAREASGSGGSNQHGPSGGTSSDPREAPGGAPSDPDEANGGTPSNPDDTAGGHPGTPFELLPASCDEVVFDDPALENIVELMVGVTSGPISPELARQQLTLHLTGHHIQSLKGLECFPNLTRLDLGNNGISALDPLSHLTRLTYLDLSGNQIVNLGPIQERDQLEVLMLSSNKIADLSPLAKLTRLTTLRLSRNALTQIDVIGSMKELRVLSLDRNAGLADISALDSLALLEELDLDEIPVDRAVLDDKPALTILSVEDSGIDDIGFLAHCGALRQIDVAGDPVSDISALGKLSKLDYVNLDRTNVRDIMPLADNPGIGAGDTVFAQGMSWDDCQAQLSGIEAMIDRGATVLVPCEP